MGRNRALGAPEEVSEIVTMATLLALGPGGGIVAPTIPPLTTKWPTDTYLINVPAPFTVILDLNAVEGDEVRIIDISGNASANPITVKVNPKPTPQLGNPQGIVGFPGGQVVINQNNAGIEFNFAGELNAWIPSVIEAPGDVPARAWADNHAAVALPVGTPTVVASALVTPQLSGKFRVLITAAPFTDAGPEADVQVSVSIGPNATPATYSGQTVAVEGARAGGELISLVVDLDQLPTPVTFPTGSSVQINAVLTSSTVAASVPAHNCQIEVQEVL